MLEIRLKRVYEPPDDGDGYRVLIDRLWPRGVSKERAQLDEWARELAPSSELRRWYGHDPERFEEFRRRYEQELAAFPERLEELREHARRGRLTLLFAAQREELTNAAVLEQVLRRA